MKTIVLRIILVVAMVVASLQANAQVKAFEKYADTKNVTYVYISKYMLAMAGKNAAPSVPNVDMKSLANKLTGIQLINSDEKVARTRLKNDVYSIITRDKYTLLMQVKEDDQQLFGFLDKEDLVIFKKVIGVSGIGPKGALSLLSQMTASELHFAVVSGDAKTISQTPGIGKKTAEKIVLELRDKFDSDELLAAAGFDRLQQGIPAEDTEMSEAVEALVALGYSKTDAMYAVRAIYGAGEMVAEELIRMALTNLM